MKKFKRLSIALVYIFMVTLMPVNAMVTKVNAAEAQKVKNTPYYTTMALQYKDKTFLVGREAGQKEDAAINFTVLENGKKQVVKDNVNSVWEVLGHEGSSYCLESKTLNSSGELTSSDLYVLNAENNSLQLKSKDYASKAKEMVNSKYKDAELRPYPMVLYSNSGNAWLIFYNKTGGQTFIANTDGYVDAVEKDWNLDGIFTGNDGSLYIALANYTQQKPQIKMLHVSNDKTKTEYSISEDARSHNWMQDSKGDFYCISNNYDPAAKYDQFILKVKVDKSSKSISKDKVVGGANGGMRMIDDAQGGIWVNMYGNAKDTGRISKIENDALVEKYDFGECGDCFSIYNDEKAAAFAYAQEELGYATTVETNDGSASKPETPETKPGTPETKPETPAVKPSIPATNPAKVDKNQENVLEPAVNGEKVEAKIDVESMKDGKGSFKVENKKAGITAVLPFSTVDVEGLNPGDYIDFSNTTVQAPSTIKDRRIVGKMFDFTMSVMNSAGEKVRDIHKFKNGKARIEISLSKEDLNGLNPASLTAFYYNEQTGELEDMGGSYDASTGKFTFETSHFSKYVLGEKQPAMKTMPKTGSPVDTSVLVGLGLLSAVAGAAMLLKKKN